MKRYLKIILLVFTLSILGLVMNNTVNAATVTLSAPSEVTVGETITVTANINAAQWNLSISKDGTVLNSSNELVNAESNLTKSFSATYTPTTAGTVTFTLSGDYTDIDLTNKEISTTKTVTVKEKVQEPTTPTEPETPSNTETPSTGTTTTPDTPATSTTPTVTEPKFTDTNKTMYATGSINLRASWSTASAATNIAKGTELTVTGTSTEKVNGYVWYRVSYNGTTKYVASGLLTSTKPEEEEKSNNAYLKSLTIEGQELTPSFNKETTSYTMQVSNDITELNITAETEDEKATVEIQGNKDLKEGENTVTISVNAEDNTIKIYEITVTKSEETALGLKSLKIADTDIESMFKTNLYNYEIDIEDVSKLEIEAIANDETATVEILGNEDLQEGENTITIIVSSQNGEEKVTYQIKATKVIGKVNNAIDEKKEIDPKIYVFIVVGIILLIALVIVIVYTIKHRNEEEYDYTDNFEGFPEELPERQESARLYNKNFDVEETQNVDTINEQENSEETEIEDKKAKIDYFLDDEEDDERPRRRRGKHF